MIDVIEKQLQRGLRTLTLEPPDDDFGAPMNYQVFSGTYQDIDTELEKLKASVTAAVVVRVNAGYINPLYREAALVKFDIQIDVIGNAKYISTQGYPRLSSLQMAIIKYLNETTAIEITGETNTRFQFERMDNLSSAGMLRFNIYCSLNVALKTKPRTI